MFENFEKIKKLSKKNEIIFAKLFVVLSILRHKNSPQIPIFCHRYSI